MQSYQKILFIDINVFKNDFSQLQIYFLETIHRRIFFKKGLY